MPRKPAKAAEEERTERTAALLKLTMELDAMRWRREAIAAVPTAWREVEREHPVHPRRVKLTLRLDDDVARFFRGQGEGYQARMNAVLRAYMVAKLAEVA